jgi:hypothetical protein
LAIYLIDVQSSGRFSVGNKLKLEHQPAAPTYGKSRPELEIIHLAEMMQLKNGSTRRWRVIGGVPPATSPHSLLTKQGRSDYRAKPTARCRRQHAGRVRSPMPTAWFRIKPKIRSSITDGLNSKNLHFLRFPRQSHAPNGMDSPIF